MIIENKVFFCRTTQADDGRLTMYLSTLDGEVRLKKYFTHKYDSKVEVFRKFYRIATGEVDISTKDIRSGNVDLEGLTFIVSARIETSTKGNKYWQVTDIKPEYIREDDRWFIDGTLKHSGKGPLKAPVRGNK